MTHSSCIAAAPSIGQDEDLTQPPRLTLVVPAPERQPLLLTPTMIEGYQPTLLRIARRMVGNATLADDIVQDTWISALQSASAFEGRASVLTWLIAIMRRRICDSRRQNKRTMLPLDDQSWTAPARWADAVDARDLLRAIDSDLVNLSDRERAALLLCDVDEEDRDAAAEKLEVTQAHLRVLLHRGRRRLRDAALAQLGGQTPTLSASSSDTSR